MELSMSLLKLSHHDGLTDGIVDDAIWSATDRITLLEIGHMNAV
jgi:hypothetical protein